MVYVDDFLSANRDDRGAVHRGELNEVVDNLPGSR